MLAAYSVITDEQILMLKDADSMAAFLIPAETTYSTCL